MATKALPFLSNSNISAATKSGMELQLEDTKGRLNKLKNIMNIDTDGDTEYSHEAENKIDKEEEYMMALPDQYKCVLCKKLCQDPVTTSCQHNFCKMCIF